MSKFVDDIPAEFLPSEEEHIEYEHTIRALRNGACDINSFLPTFIERNQNSFLLEDPSVYALSLFTTIEQIKKRFKPFHSFWKSHEGFAEGPTKSERGIAMKSSDNGHISFFLFDTFGNNPCQDFRIVIEEPKQ